MIVPAVTVIAAEPNLAEFIVLFPVKYSAVKVVEAIIERSASVSSFSLVTLRVPDPVIVLPDTTLASDEIVLLAPTVKVFPVSNALLLVTVTI